jgi:7-cyano-7-deazaguanine synthase
VGGTKDSPIVERRLYGVFPSYVVSAFRRAEKGRLKLASTYNSTALKPARETTRVRNAVVLLSGGLDSYTAAAMVQAEGFRLFALTIRYGQRHAHELESARAVAAALGVARHVELDVDLAVFGGSSLTTTAPVPKDRPIDPSEIPSTYVPARNTVFLALSLAWAETLGAEDLVIGVNAVDYSGYPDCRPEFLTAFERLASLATAQGVKGGGCRIHAPLLRLTKGEIIRRGLELGLDYGLTHSCYDPGPGGRPCNRCDSCALRAAGFAAAGVPDPLLLR